MKLLFDQNISFRITKKLKAVFQEAKHVSDCGLSNAEDPEIWKFAKANGFTIVTFDGDFFDIGLINDFPPKIIWLRAANLSTQALAKLLLNNESTIQSFINDTGAEATACLELE